jgi:hypothetical protein
MTLALSTNVPVVALASWDLPDAVAVDDPAQAVDLALELARR